MSQVEQSLMMLETLLWQPEGNLDEQAETEQQQMDWKVEADLQDATSWWTGKQVEQGQMSSE